MAKNRGISTKDCDPVYHRRKIVGSFGSEIIFIIIGFVIGLVMGLIIIN